MLETNHGCTTVMKISQPRSVFPVNFQVPKNTINTTKMEQSTPHTFKTNNDEGDGME